MKKKEISIILASTILVTSFTLLFIVSMILFPVSHYRSLEEYAGAYAGTAVFAAAFSLVVATGAAFSLWTHFGFFKHRWVSLKWILIILQIVFGTFWLGRWLTANAHMTVEEGTGISGSATFLRN